MTSFGTFDFLLKPIATSCAKRIKYINYDKHCISEIKGKKRFIYLSIYLSIFFTFMLVGKDCDRH